MSQYNDFVSRTQRYILVSPTSTENISYCTDVIMWGQQKKEGKKRNIHITSSRTVKTMTLHTLQHPTSCRCCTFLPDSVKSRNTVNIYSMKLLVGEKMFLQSKSYISGSDDAVWRLKGCKVR